MKIEPSRRVYLITGFVLSGWIYWVVGKVKLPNEHTRKWEAMEIPTKDLKFIYFWLEIVRKIKLLLKKIKRRAV